MAVFPHSIAFHLPFWEGIPNLAFSVQFDRQFQQKQHNLTHERLVDFFRKSSHLFLHLNMVMEYFNRKGYLLSLWYIIPFPLRRDYPKYCSVHKIGELTLTKMTWFETWGTYLSHVRNSSSPLHTSNESYETPQHQWMSFSATQDLIPCEERVPQIWCFVCNFRVNLGWDCTVWPR